MGKWSSPKRGTQMLKGNRAKSLIPRIRKWPDKNGILGFTAYKAGITHAIIIETNKQHRLAGKEHKIPVTILETPPLIIAGIRGYKKTPYGIRAAGEVWSDQLPKETKKSIKTRKKGSTQKQLKKFQKLDNLKFIRIITATQPYKVKSIPKKTPETMEQAIGGNLEEQLKQAKELLGKELPIKDAFKPGDAIDAFAISKGHGFQGVIKRTGAKLEKRKYETQRKIGTLGPFTPGRVMPTVPQAGQMGYHQRFSLNNVILKISQPITPKGGWPHYGETQNPCLIIQGTLPGPTKRLIRIRKSIRWDYPYDVPEITHLSLTAKN